MGRDKKKLREVPSIGRRIKEERNATLGLVSKQPARRMKVTANVLVALSQRCKSIDLSSFLAATCLLARAAGTGEKDEIPRGDLPDPQPGRVDVPIVPFSTLLLCNVEFPARTSSPEAE